MNVLALNPGSGTLRYKLLAMPQGGGCEADEPVLKEGKVDHVHGGATVEAAERAVAECLPLGVAAIGYRVVHGGPRFDAPTRIQSMRSPQRASIRAGSPRYVSASSRYFVRPVTASAAASTIAASAA